MSESRTTGNSGTSTPNEPIKTNVTVVPHAPAPTAPTASSSTAPPAASTPVAQGESPAGITVVSRIFGRMKMMLSGDNTDNETTAVMPAVPSAPKPAPEPQPSGNTSAPAKKPGRNRKARLRISHIDPWSVMKTAFLFSVAFAVIGFVAVWVLWIIIDLSGVLKAIQDGISSLVGNPDGSSGFQVSEFIDVWRVLGFTAIVGVSNVFLITALATLMSFLYNLAANILGGLEVTLAED